MSGAKTSIIVYRNSIAVNNHNGSILGQDHAQGRGPEEETVAPPLTLGQGRGTAREVAVINNPGGRGLIVTQMRQS